jgi:hypothetical protein
MLKSILAVLISFSLSNAAYAKKSLKKEAKPTRVQNTDLDLKRQNCIEFTGSLETEAMCIADEDLSIERISLCFMQTTDVVSEALCLIGGLSAEIVSNCFLNTPSVIQEQVCLLGPDYNLVSSSQMESDIENIIGVGVEIDMLIEAFIFSDETSL